MTQKNNNKKYDLYRRHPDGRAIRLIRVIMPKASLWEKFIGK